MTDLTKLVTILQRYHPELTAEELADVIWLARKMSGEETKNSIESKTIPSGEDHPPVKVLPDSGTMPSREDHTSARTEFSRQGHPPSELHLDSQQEKKEESKKLGALPFRSPRATALPGALEIARELRPFMRKVKHPTELELDEEATIERVVAGDLWIPKHKPALTSRRFDVALVIDKSASMAIWQQTATELYQLLACHGAFRDVKTWELVTDNADHVSLFVRASGNTHSRQVRSELELIDMAERRLILVLTDCMSAAWYSGRVADILAKWGQHNSVTLIQVLPQPLWVRTAIGIAEAVRLYAPAYGIANTQLGVQSTYPWNDEDEKELPNSPVPVVTLEQGPLARWSQVLTRVKETWIPGYKLPVSYDESIGNDEYDSDIEQKDFEFTALSPVERVNLFYANSSLTACRLAELLTVVPVSLPTIRLVQQAVLPKSRQVHVAEVFLGGLLRVISTDYETLDPDLVEYDFVDGVRDVLQDSLTSGDAVCVLDKVSDFLEREYSQKLSFRALIANPLQTEGISIGKESKPFANIAAKFLRRFGGNYASLADQLEQLSSPELGPGKTDHTGKSQTDASHFTTTPAAKIEPNNIELPQEAGADPSLNPEQKHSDESSSTNLPQNIEKIQKLFILALGTTGGEVGLIFKQQAAQRTAKDFHYKMLCLDTSDQLRKSGRLAPHEFVHLVTVNTILANSERVAPKLHEMLYPQFPPPPSTANGAGGIRYSAATLLALPALQNSIRSHLSTLIGQLADVDVDETKSRDISFVIVISAVGATGSGALSLLIPLMLEAINNAGIAKPNIDVIILHPVLSVSNPLLLANAEALYIELAATQNDAVHNSYTGRKIILGSGGQSHTITQLEELGKTAATLVRLTTDAHYGITQSYWNTLPNRGVLRGLEIQTLLPTHLSSATPVTIGLANLGKQVIEIDTAKLVSRLIYGVRHQDQMPTHVNTLLSDLNSFQGHDADASYQLLLDSFTATLRNGLGSNTLSPAALKRLNNAQKAERIRSQYHNDLDLIEQEKPKIRPQAQERFKDWKQRLNEERRKYLLTDRSLIQLLRDDRERLDRLRNLQAAASKVKVSPPFSEKLLERMLYDVSCGKAQAILSYIAAVQQNLASQCKTAALQAAIMFLNNLEAECQEAIQHANAFIQEADERFRSKPGWNSNASTLQVHNDHSLYIPALSSQQDIEQYYNQVSIFAQSNTQQDLFSEEDDARIDPLASFRTTLKEQNLVRHFFDGYYTKIFTAIELHVENSVSKQLDNYPLMKVFESTHPAVLRACLFQALGRAQPLMPFSHGFASSSVAELYVTAFWSNERQHSMLQEALSQISQNAKLIKSDNPTEIIVFYLIDGLAMSAINELTSRCLEAFLAQRSQWTLYNRNLTQHGHMRGIPVYSGYNLEMRVRQQNIANHLYEARQRGVGNYTASQIPELAAPNASNELQNGSGGTHE